MAATVITIHGPQFPSLVFIDRFAVNGGAGTANDSINGWAAGL